MKANEILDKIEEYIKEELDPAFPRGILFQEPYKSDYFKLFTAAYDNHYFDINSNPRLTGQAIKDYFSIRWHDRDNKEKCYVKLNLLINMWDEWIYAFDHMPEYS